LLRHSPLPPSRIPSSAANGPKLAWAHAELYLGTDPVPTLEAGVDGRVVPGLSRHQACPRRSN
jgi:hypothetical protein